MFYFRKSRLYENILYDILLYCIGGHNIFLRSRLRQLKVRRTEIIPVRERERLSEGGRNKEQQLWVPRRCIVYIIYT